MKLAIVNAFSINMLNDNCGLLFDKIENPADFLREYEVYNFIGHKDLDNIVRQNLNISIPEGVRGNVDIDNFDILLVAQYSGPRLPVGTTQLPEGAKIEYWLIKKPDIANIDGFDVFVEKKENLEYLLGKLPY